MLKKTFLLFYFLLTCLIVTAQTMIPISGIVQDAATGEPVIGVNVAVKGGKIGTMTDINGSFSLQVPANAILTFTYVGYKPLDEAINGRTDLQIKLSPKTEMMDEVVVVGYTSLKRNDVLGAVSKVGSQEITALPVASTEQALQGRIAGVQVSNSTGAPGADISVRIRGVGSVSSSNAPLYIVDGIPVEDALNGISPNDIESITVLKDASSAAIYGSRANNGVVLVTTKSGKGEKAQISYNGYYGFQTHGRLIPMANTTQYVDLYNQAVTNDNASSSTTRTAITGDYLNNLADVDYVSSIFRTAPMTSHELNISGSNNKVNYFISGSYFDQNGIILNSGYTRGTIHAKLNADVKKWLTIGFDMNGSLSTTHSVSASGDGYNSGEGGSVVRYAMFRNPAIPIYDANGDYVDLPSNYFGNSLYDTFFGNGYNPVALAKNTDRTTKKDLIFAKVYAKIKLPFNLELVNNIGIDKNNTNLKIYNKTWGDNNRVNSPNNLTVDLTNKMNWTFNSVLNYKKTINNIHHISSLVGFEAIHNSTKTLNSYDEDFPVWDKSVIYIGNGLGDKTISETEENSSLASFFGQAAYDYDGRYYASGTIRRDGSSKFAKKNRWGTFYSASIGWNIDREKFMQKFSVINKLKLRAGWGAIGNQNIASYANADTYSANYNYAFGGTSSYGYAESSLGNSNLKWETSKQLNVGLDIELWEGMWGLSIDYFNKITSNMLVQATLPPSSGVLSSEWINNGKVQNKGIDIETTFRKIYKKGRFDITLNGSYVKNEVLEMNTALYGGRVDNGLYATKTEKGYPIGSFFMYKMDGIFQNETDIVTSAYQGSSILPGDVKFKDENNDNIIDSNDRVHVGSSIPKVTMGLNLNGQWNNFDLGIFFQGAFGQKIYNQILTDCEGFYRGFNVTQRYYDNHWTGEGTTNKYPRASWSAKSNNARVSTRFLEDGSYLRMKNIQLGYTLNLKSFGVDKIRMYMSATNLLTLTKYSGMDPEMTVSSNSTGEADRANGIDWGTYPSCRTYTMGVNITF